MVSITQIVLNMLVNARDAMPRGGEVRVTVEPPTDRASGVDLVIADTGHGIEAADLERIFEPFYSTKPAGVGTGLGLANVKALVEGLEGSLHVESKIDSGTRFRVTLPLVDELPQVDAERAEAEPMDVEARSILLVDDSDSVRRIAKSILEQADHRVNAVPRVSEAIEWLKICGEVDLVITDIVMPGESGAALIAWLRKEAPEVRVLVISAYTEDEQLKRGMQTGELPFLAKPFAASELLDATRQVLK